MRRTYCSNDCDYQKYYASQAGTGLSDIRIFRGFPYQRGYGLGSVVKRFGIPLLKFLGKHLLSTGMAIGADVLGNRVSRETVKNRLKEGGRVAAKEGLPKVSAMVDQVGSGKRLYKKAKPKVKRKKKDIFG